MSAKEPTALVVEDQEDHCVMWSEAVEQAGYSVEVIRSGDTALTWLRAEAPDLIVLNLRLPRVPGVDILAYVRSEDRMSDTRVIAVTTDSQLGDEVGDQADVLFLKPMSFHELRATAARLKPDELDSQSPNHASGGGA